MRIDDQFLITCRENYFSGVRPAGNDSKSKEGYQQLIRIAQSYFTNNREEDFAGLLMEGQYFIQLWTAHLTFEYGQPDKKLSEECVEIIKQYSESEHETEVAIQEKKWLDKYGSKYIY